MDYDRSRTSLIVAVCTYRRNKELAVLLEALLLCAKLVSEQASVGVVVIDDTPAGDARVVAEQYQDRFELGLTYRISGKRNISEARNLALNTAIALGEWVVMTDDDCEPPAEWLLRLLAAQKLFNADCVAGRMVRRPPDGSPKWLFDEPFLELGVADPPDGTELEAGATFNSIIRSRWLQDRPHIRFDPAFGVIGGEDMVFFRAARAEGLVIRFSSASFVFENEPADRATFGYQLFIHFWHGNSTYLSGVESGVPRWRMVVHGVASLARATWRAPARLLRGQSPQWRYGLARVLHAMGQLAGPLGIRVKHR